MRPIIVILILALSVQAQAATRYVDQVSGACSGNYSIANRNCTGSDGYSYATVQAGVNALNVGDTLYMRGGTYSVGTSSGGGCIIMPYDKNGTAWTEGNYTTLASYPGEWAVLDGQNNCGTYGYVLGFYPSGGDFADTYDMKYWKLERFEVKNGNGSRGDMDSGIMWQGGPLWIRYLYVHDNVSDNGTENPGGLRAYHLNNSIIEYSYFYNNGTAAYSDNSGHIVIFGDYHYATWLANGYSGGSSSYVSVRNNIIRYNYFNDTGGTAIKYKSYSCLSGRNTANGFPESYTYQAYGDNIHHNIIVDALFTGILAHQDFTQVHHNIIENVSIGISTNYEAEYPDTFANVIYNNTFVDVNTARHGGSYYGSIFHFGLDTSGMVPAADEYHTFYDYNNIIDNGNGSSGQINSGQVQNSLKRVYKNSNNYFYRPASNNIIRYGATLYTQSTYEAQTATDTPRVAYQNSYDAENLLWTETSGANKYIPRTAHAVESGVTIANGGVGGAHPYLSGVTIPSYLGAVNPSDSSWVAGVLSLTSTAVLQAGTSSDPSWIEGSGTQYRKLNNVSGARVTLH